MDLSFLNRIDWAEEALDQALSIMNPPVLSYVTRKLLHDLGVREVRNTSLSQMTKCPLLFARDTEHYNDPEFVAGDKHHRFLIGSALHYLFEHHERLSGTVADYHLVLEGFKVCSQKGPYNISEDMMVTYSIKMCDPKLFGDHNMSMVWIVKDIMNTISSRGGKVVASELVIEFIDGVYYPIHFHSTIDLVLEISGKIYIMDVKSWGLTDLILKGKMPSAISLTPKQIMSSRQLLTYSWMYWKSINVLPDRIGYIFPTNAIPNKRGANKGEARGLKFVFADAPKQSVITSIEKDIVAQLELFCIRRPRFFPEDFGKSSCSSCLHFDNCFGDAHKEKVDNFKEQVDCLYDGLLEALDNE